MRINVTRATRIFPAPLFIAFTFSVAGWALLEMWLVQMRAGLRMHGIALLIGIWFCYFSARRPRIGQFDHPADREEDTAGRLPPPSVEVDFRWAVLLFILGCLLGVSVLSSLTMLVLVVAGPMTVIPWAQVRFCRTHFFAACSAVWTGMLLVLAFGHALIAPFTLALASWALWSMVFVSLVVRIANMARADRLAKLTAASALPTASADTSL